MTNKDKAMKLAIEVSALYENYIDGLSEAEDVHESQVKLIVAYSDQIRGECIIESKHMYQVGFEHGQNNVMYVLRELITPLLDSVGQRAVHTQEWECEQVDIIRKYLKG